MDSIYLMSVTKQIMKIDGVTNAVAVMGTEMNKTVLVEFGGLTPEAAAASPNDLIIALVLTDERAIEKVLACLSGIQTAETEVSSGSDAYSSLRMAAEAEPEANLAIISVPGEFAGQEAKTALSHGMNVFIFSDNVPLSEEVELKRIAEGKGLFVMGPGCGTSVINNISIGVMSQVRKGRIGIVGASGSGIHEIALQIHRAGLGISQAIGTGGKDISREVGGSTMIRSIGLLEKDEETDVIVVVSKPPHPETVVKVLAEISRCRKPVVIFFLGGKRKEITAAGAHCAESLEHAAGMAVSLAKGEEVLQADYREECLKELQAVAREEQKKLIPGQKYLRAIFCGGTHSEEAVLMLQDMVPTLHSNLSFGKVTQLKNRNLSVENTLVDMGDEEFTKGKPHPVMDPSILNDRLLSEGTDPEVAVILFDLLFGHGIHKDPVGAIEGTLMAIREKGKKEGRYVSIVASLCGTDLDTQGVDGQKKRLQDLGVLVAASNAKAAILGGMIIG
jgi:succinyl-CoA synthetase alpha subunit